MNRGVKTDNGALHACDPVVVAGLKLWLYVRISSELVALMISIPALLSGAGAEESTHCTVSSQTWVSSERLRTIP
jgi:hypothetical protein